MRSMTRAAETELGARAMARLETLARFTEERGRLTRRYLTEAHRRAADQVLAWMREAGMRAEIDPAGNVVGRYEGAEPDGPALLLGSHIDTVRDAGRYDGNLGVVAGIACVEVLSRHGRRLPFALEVIAFGDEEGGRFPTTLTGARAIAGRLEPAVLETRDAAGIRLADALTAFGGDPGGLAAAARSPARVLAYIELHIEQGPVLETEGLALGVVTAISGASRYELELVGQAGHAGTVPMAQRLDALAGASEMILAIEAAAVAEPEVVATVGWIETLPGAVNVVPGQVRFSLDLRAPEDSRRRATAETILARCSGIAERRRLALTAECTHDALATACDPRLVTQLEATLRSLGLRPLRLPSGAGHDGMAFRGLWPVGMLFLRCASGISHHPSESVTVEDVDLAIRALLDFLEHFEAPAATPAHETS